MSLLLPTEDLNLSLQQAIQSIAHTNGTATTNSPSLTIRGLKTPLIFPLTSNQVRRIIPYTSPSPHGQTTRTVLDSSVRSSLQIDSTNIQFPETWQSHLSTIVHRALHELTIDPEHVDYRFDKLLLYRRGDHFRAHTDSEKVQGMFGTLIIQLPSKFSGGELVLRYDGKETVYSNGGDDGSCDKNIFFTAFFADVEHEIRVVKSGYRLVLVYNLIRNGVTPTFGLVDRDLGGVQKELKEIVKDAPCKAWMFALPLNHLYTISSLTKFGIAAFKNNDATNLAALRIAARNIGAEELEIAVCVLSRWHEEIDLTGDGFNAYPHRVHILELLAEDGANFPDRLGFVDFSSAMEAAKLVIKKQTKARYTGNEGVRRETLYRTAIVLVWPKNKRFYLLGRDECNLERFLTEESEDSYTTRIERALTWFESIRVKYVSPKVVRVLAEQVVKLRLSRQSPRLMKLALAHVKEEPARQAVVALVRQFGWRRFADLLEEYLCNSKLKKQKHMHGPVETVHDLGRLVHQPVRIRALGILVNFFKGCFTRLEEKNTNIIRSSWYDQLDAINLFARLLSSLMTAEEEVDATGKRILQEHLDLSYALLDKFDTRLLKELTEEFQNVTQGNNSESAKPRMRKLESRIYHVRKERFMRDCEYILSRFTGPPPEKTDVSEGDSQERYIDFDRFTELAFSLMTHDPVPEEVSSTYWKFLSVIRRLPADAVNGITRTVESIQNSEKCVLPYIHGTVLHAKDITDILQLQKKEREHISQTTEEPNDVRIIYNDVHTGIPKIDRFLRTKATWFQFQTKTREVTDDVSERARRALPVGFKVVPWMGEGGFWFVEVEKPFHEEACTRHQYERNVKYLGEVRKNIKTIRERKRKLPDRDVAKSLVKRSKRSDLSTMWKVYDM